MVAVALLAVGCAPVRSLDRPGWQQFKEGFVTPEGRVVDSGSASISHSEGQGVGMLLAVAHEDRPTFERLWQWTQTNLRVRDDHLLAWRWNPATQPPVQDRNNATDGDIFVAWALLRANRRWSVPEYRDSAHAMMHDLQNKVVHRTAFGPVLLPGANGFHDNGSPLAINPSYWVFPALAEFARAEPLGTWNEVQQTGVRLLREGRFGRWGLPPDWLTVGERLSLAEKFPPRFSYDAIRVPLYVAWGQRQREISLYNFVEFWSYFDGAQFTPSWTDLTDDSVATYDASPGFYAVMQLAYAVSGSGKSIAIKRERGPDDKEDYYSTTLRLLANLAWVEADL